MKKCNLVLMTSGLVLFMSTVARADMPWQIVYQTDFATNQGWQTNNADNYYLDSRVGVDPPAYHQKEIDKSEEYAYHSLRDEFDVPLLNPALPWRLEYDILPVSHDWAGDARLVFVDEDMAVSGDDRENFFGLNFPSIGAGNVMMIEWINDEDIGDQVIFGTFQEGEWYQCLLEWRPGTSELYAKVTHG